MSTQKEGLARMIQLALFMAHCAAAFALLGMGVLRQAQIARVRRAGESERMVFFRLVLPAGRWPGWVFTGIEAGTGVALLAFSPWRESLFSVAMLVLAIVWAAGLEGWRTARRDPSGECLRSLSLWRWTETAGRITHGAMLTLIALV